MILGTISAFCETFFYSSVTHYFGSKIGLFTFLFLFSSPGMFIASTAYLPSSFSMLFLMVAFGFWMKDKLGMAVFCVAGATLMGWPFCVVLALPLAIHSIYSLGLFKTIGWGLYSLICFVVPSCLVDFYFYEKLIFPPINIILYNVFTSHGADLYGTEPWSFYIINLFLNFNILLPLATLSLPIFSLWIYLRPVLGGWKSILFVDISSKLLPLYIWMGIMLKMAHKEERFLFVIYPLLCLAAAVSLVSSAEIVPLLLRSFNCDSIKIHKVVRFIKSLIWFGVSLSFLLSASRIVGNAINYSAPFFIWNHIASVETNQNREVNVCVAKEWYRFPSHFFLPKGYEIRFIPRFGGQLPQLFDSKYGTSLSPPYFNDINREETSRYFNVKDCDLLIDLELPNVKETYLNDMDWIALKKAPFLLSSHSHPLTRAFYIPFLSSHKNFFANYTLFEKRNV
eukprot:TRINITY_DN2327_c0_g2_i4.p1 TRINITY_DN2327_c0_g2~~TRINITY_DN2327_c0_g2_i4.p1  ORF type:complete len:453 (-),score=40.07 TRINITY_DN2327_c0_g2_i4:251-1609(-)